MASSNCEWSIYVGKLVKCLRVRDVKMIFERFGPLEHAEIKYDTEKAYAFIDFKQREDAEKCLRHACGWMVNGQKIIVEWAKGRKDNEMGKRSDVTSSENFNVCKRCRRAGHWARNCPEVGRLGRRQKIPIRSGKESADDEMATGDATDGGAQAHEPVNLFPPPPNTMYNVMVTRSYTRQRPEELNLELGEVIYVIPFEGDGEQDEGWQLGIKASDGTKGIFPSNVTQKLSKVFGEVMLIPEKIMYEM